MGRDYDVPSHLRPLASYLAIAPRSVDGTLSFAWTFGLVCFTMLLAAAGLAIEQLALTGSRDQLGLAAIGAALGGAGTLWCIRMRRRRLAERARWRAAADQLASSVGGRVLAQHEILPWLVEHWPHPVRVEDFAHSPCAHAIATRSALIHFEPEGTKIDDELPEAHLVVLGRNLRAHAGFIVETIESTATARLDAPTRARVLASPETLAHVAPSLRALLDT